jgi:phosphoglycerol transferase MdoB-like AlkP superfamily enzyme
MARNTSPPVAARRLFWGAVWLAIVFVAIKAYYLGLPPARAMADAEDYFLSLAAISYVDVLFAAVIWLAARTVVALAGGRRGATPVITTAFLTFAAFSLMYAVANVVVFGVFGGFMTYPLLALVGNVRMLSSSASAYATRGAVTALVALPVVYLALVLGTVRIVPAASGAWRPRGVAFASLGAWLILGQYAFAAGWTTKQDRRIAENPHWVLLSSWWQVVSGEHTVRMADKFAPGDLADFDPLGMQAPAPPSTVLRRISARAGVRAAAAPRPLNVVFVVLESVAARWAGLNGGPYDSTPKLKAESAHGIVFDNFYAHIGRSSNSLASMLLSTYPKLGFRDLTEEYPHLAGTPLPALLRDRGYHTGFVTPSDLAWAGWGSFLQGRGFDELHDHKDLACSPMISSWGVEDRCMVEGMIDFIHRNPSNPFFLMGWTTQTHHPYEPTPGVPLLEMEHEPVPDQYELGRYLNVLHETDHQLSRLFDAIRLAGLDQNTLVVVVGDHGQAFGYPHDTYIQGRTVYEEDVHVPLLIWSPRHYASPVHSPSIGSLVDLAPTIAALAGAVPAADWQGRNLFDAAHHPPRAYFYVAEDHFTLGLREDHWKYIFDLREGTDELYDLDRDPNEQHNLAKSDPDRSARFRQRLAAWTEANRRQYERMAH